jgi:DNA anti-recombination protein RmuC
MSYTPEEIKELKERAKQQYEELKKEREKQREQKQLEEKMKEEAESRAWRNVIAEETRYFNPKQKAIWNEILNVLGRTEETLKPSDIGFALSQENEVKYQLIALINELLREKLDMGTMSFTEEHGMMLDNIILDK